VLQSRSHDRAAAANSSPEGELSIVLLRATECTGPVLDRVNDFDVIDCRSCGWIHVFPAPSTDELASLYRSHYYGTEKPLYIERYEEDRAWWDLTYADRFDSFESFLPADRRRILDVGSGPGLFLLSGKKRGWQGLGIEPAQQAAAHSRGLGLEIIERFLTQDLASEIGTFDVVHMSEVLEHIPDARTFVELASGLLEPGGLLCIVVPNDYNPLQRVLREQDGYAPWWVAPPHHLNYFSPASLRSLLESIGLETLVAESTFPIELFLLFGDNYVGNDALGRQCHGRRKRLEVLLDRGGLTDLRRRVYRALASEGIGREIMIVARKPVTAAAVGSSARSSPTLSSEQ
jgi:SAM-dependent methyltransferase